MVNATIVKDLIESIKSEVAWVSKAIDDIETNNDIDVSNIRSAVSDVEDSVSEAEDKLDEYCSDVEGMESDLRDIVERLGKVVV